MNPGPTLSQQNGLRQMYRALQDQLYREDALLKNEHMSATDRVVFLMMERLYPGVRTTSTPIAVWKLAQASGVSRSAVSRFFVAMYESGYIDYRIDRKGVVKEGKGEIVSEVSVQELEACKRVGELNTLDTPKRTKDRLRCRSCGSTRIQLREIATCTVCGEVQYDRVHIVGEEDEKLG